MDPTAAPSAGHSHPDRRMLISTGVVALGAALVMASGFMVWFRIFGTDLTGFRMARLVNDYADVVDSVTPGFLGVLWYILPLAGAVTWILLFITTPIGVRRTHVVLGAIMVITVGVFLVVAADRSEITTGPVVALLGGLLITGGGLVGLSPRRQ